MDMHHTIRYESSQEYNRNRRRYFNLTPISVTVFSWWYYADLLVGVQFQNALQSLPPDFPKSHRPERPVFLPHIKYIFSFRHCATIECELYNKMYHFLFNNS